MSESGKPRLLYVEDDHLINELGVTAFEDAGFAVQALYSGAAAIKALDKDGSDFKALITDIDLGRGPKGWLVAKHARELFPDIPVIYVSGASASDWPSLGVPGSILVVKPYAAAQLVVAVSNATLSADRSASENS